MERAQPVGRAGAVDVVGRVLDRLPGLAAVAVLPAAVVALAGLRHGLAPGHVGDDEPHPRDVPIDDGVPLVLVAARLPHETGRVRGPDADAGVVIHLGELDERPFTVPLSRLAGVLVAEGVEPAARAVAGAGVVQPLESDRHREAVARVQHRGDPLHLRLPVGEEDRLDAVLRPEHRRRARGVRERPPLRDLLVVGQGAQVVGKQLDDRRAGDRGRDVRLHLDLERLVGRDLPDPVGLPGAHRDALRAGHHDAAGDRLLRRVQEARLRGVDLDGRGVAGDAE